MADKRNVAARKNHFYAERRQVDFVFNRAHFQIVGNHNAFETQFVAKQTRHHGRRQACGIHGVKRVIFQMPDHNHKIRVIVPANNLHEGRQVFDVQNFLTVLNV